MQRTDDRADKRLLRRVSYRDMTWRDSRGLSRAARVHEERLAHRSRYTVCRGLQHVPAATLLRDGNTTRTGQGRRRHPPEALMAGAERRILSTLKLTSAIRSYLFLKALGQPETHSLVWISVGYNGFV